MFVVLEGIDGSGKTSVTKALVERFTSESYSVSTTTEPTTLIRPLLGAEQQVKDPVSLFLLFTADRMNHQQEIKKLLKENDIVICDRYILSSLAYQGVLISEKSGNWNDTVKWMKGVSKFIEVEADFTLLLDVDPETSLKRIREKRGSTDPYFENTDYLVSVRKAYLDLLSGDFARIDSTGTLEPVIQDSYSALKKFIESREKS